LQKTFATKNYLVALGKLHKIVVANVDEVNGQQVLHHPYTIVCHPYITIKINNLHNDTWKMEKGLKFFVLKIDGGSSSSIFSGFRL
jgi:hypothetical protein